MFSHV